MVYLGGEIEDVHPQVGNFLMRTGHKFLYESHAPIQGVPDFVVMIGSRALVVLECKCMGTNIEKASDQVLDYTIQYQGLLPERDVIPWVVIPTCLKPEWTAQKQYCLSRGIKLHCIPDYYFAPHKSTFNRGWNQGDHDCLCYMDRFNWGHEMNPKYDVRAQY